jgi:DNA (cytosine-5)-methyltransferase 1
MNVLSLFSGIAGLELGLERAGMTVVGQVEKDPFCLKVLAKHYPKVPKHEDVRTSLDWWLSTRRPRVDLVASGFPCQPASLAGKRKGTDDERWLWPPNVDIIDALRPDWFVFENVPGLRTRGLDVVLADLDRVGYLCRVGEISACALGAPHTRTRLFGVAHPKSRGREAGRGVRARPSLLEPERRGTQSCGPWTGEPRPHGVAYGVPSGLDRRRALGNAVVPAVAEHVGRLVMAADRAVA